MLGIHLLNNLWLYSYLLLCYLIKHLWKILENDCKTVDKKENERCPDVNSKEDN